MNILSNFKNEQLKTDQVFLTFAGVVGDIATFGQSTIPKIGISHKIYSMFINNNRKLVHLL